MTGLSLAPTLRLPLEAVTETFGILAVRGAGKSNAAAVMAEEMHRAGLPFVVVDPVGSWWGLRSSKDGTGPGLPIPIFGGRHGDVPLERGGGQLVADLLVDQRLSCVLDLSTFESEAAKKAFLLDFARRLYQRNEEPLHLFLEEADDYIPQKPMRDEAQLLRAWENIVRRGRSRGLGMTLITQRSASLNKNVLTQVQTLIALRTTGPQDRDAIEAWIKYHDQSREILSSLATLADGDAWVWSPDFLGKTVRVHFRQRSTFDSGATPKLAKGTKAPATLADVDLAAIQQKMSATIERAKQEDPKELRRELSEVRRALTVAQRSAPVAPPAPTVQRVEVPALSPDLLHRLEEASDRAFQAAAECRELYGEVRQTLEAARQVATARPASLPRPAPTPRAPAPTIGKRAAPSGETGELGRAERAILSVLAQHPDGCERGKLTLLTGYRYSGGFRNALGELRTRGMIEGGNDATMRITAEGMAAVAGQYEPLPSGPALLDYWLTHRSLGKAERAILGVILQKPDAAFTADDLTRATGYEYSGGFRNALGNLRTAGLIVGSNTGRMQANADLFS